jgi:hypothetical protein
MRLIHAGGYFFDLDDVLYACDGGVAKGGAPNGSLVIYFRPHGHMTIMKPEADQVRAFLASASEDATSPPKSP